MTYAMWISTQYWGSGENDLQKIRDFWGLWTAGYSAWVALSGIILGGLKKVKKLWNSLRGESQ
jgi:hypothetical protein